MINPGQIQELIVEKRVDFGLYLSSDGKSIEASERVLLPNSMIPANVGVGDKIKVFIYKDNQGRPIATTSMPKVTLGGYAALTITEVGKIGAFLDWGLPKELLLPYHEMLGHPEAGDEVLVRVYLDKSGRFAASMKGLYKVLSQKPPYTVGDEVEGRVYEFSRDFGTFVALDDKYSAMIPRHEGTKHLRIGDVVSLRITAIKEDGKCDVTLRAKAHLQLSEDAEALYMLIEDYAGVLPFSENASPEVIMRETGLSKAAFKRALGHLYKEQKISIENGKIRII